MPMASFLTVRGATSCLLQDTRLPLHQMAQTLIYNDVCFENNAFVILFSLGQSRLATFLIHSYKERRDAIVYKYMYF